MGTVQLSAVLRQAAEVMSMDLRTQLVPSPGERGSAREEVFRQFLRKYLPKKFEVSTGFAFDRSGRITGQLDIVIYDPSVCPRFELPGGKFLFPCEAVCAVGEVKSRTRSVTELKKAATPLALVKSLDRSAVRDAEPVRPTHGCDPRNEIFTFVVPTGQALEGYRVAEAIMDLELSSDIEELPNVILALDQYLVTYKCDYGICASPLNARGVAVHTAEPKSDALLKFFLLLGNALEGIRTGSLPYWGYLADIKDFNARVYFAATDNPPPYLASIVR